MKTQFAPVVADELYNSHKPLPAKITELFNKVNLILNPVQDDNN